MKVLNKSSANDEIKNYFKNQNNIKMFYNNSRNMLEETLKLEREQLDLGFEIDFKKELEKKQSKQLSTIYGKLKILDNPGQNPKDHADIKKMSLDVYVL